MDVVPQGRAAVVHDDPGLLEPEEQADSHSHEPDRCRDRDQATKPIPQEYRPDQRVGDEHLGQARLLAGQRQEGEQDVDGSNGENPPIASTGMERLLGVAERPGKDQNRREFESQDNAEHQITGSSVTVLVTSTREVVDVSGKNSDSLIRWLESQKRRVRATSQIRNGRTQSFLTGSRITTPASSSEFRMPVLVA